MKGNNRDADVLEFTGNRDLIKYFNAGMTRQELVKAFIQHYSALELDCLLSPVNGLPAYEHNSSMFHFMSCSHTFIYNALDFPAGVIPDVRRV